MSVNKPTFNLTSTSNHSTVGDELREGRITIKSAMCPHCKIFAEFAMPKKIKQHIAKCMYCKIDFIVTNDHYQEEVVNVVQYARGGKGNAQIIGFHYKGSQSEKEDFYEKHDNYSNITYSNVTKKYLSVPRTSNRRGRFIIKNKQKRGYGHDINISGDIVHTLSNSFLCDQ